MGACFGGPSRRSDEHGLLLQLPHTQAAATTLPFILKSRRAVAKEDAASSGLPARGGECRRDRDALSARRFRSSVLIADGNGFPCQGLGSRKVLRAWPGSRLNRPPHHLRVDVVEGGVLPGRSRFAVTRPPRACPAPRAPRRGRSERLASWLKSPTSRESVANRPKISSAATASPGKKLDLAANRPAVRHRTLGVRAASSITRRYARAHAGTSNSPSCASTPPSIVRRTAAPTRSADASCRSCLEPGDRVGNRRRAPVERHGGSPRHVVIGHRAARSGRARVRLRPPRPHGRTMPAVDPTGTTMLDQEPVVA